jgi:serine/threonine-protein kinase
MDFGIAKSLATASNLTQTGITLGTSAYLAPEQIRGEPLDGRTDIFALGILAYELLTYRKPFRGEHLSTVLYRILNEAPEPVHAINPEVPASLSAVVNKAIEKIAASRYPSMEVLQQELLAVHRQMMGSGSTRLSIPPQATGDGLTTRAVAPPTPDVTVKTPTKGMETTQMTPVHITPPSGALARVPAPEEATPPGGVPSPDHSLGVVNFRDPSQRESSRRTTTGQVEMPRRSRRGVWIGVGVVAVVGAGVAGWYVTQQEPHGVPAAAPTRAATAVPAIPTPPPAAFPQPVVGVDALSTDPSSAKPPSSAKQEAPPPSQKVAAKYPVVFSSVPMATFSVDGQRIGQSVPARTLQLSPGAHTVRFEAAGLDPAEQKFTVGPNGTPRVNYIFPFGMLVITSPAWTGANILIDNKFNGVLSGEKHIQLKAGVHRVTLSREGVNPVTEEVNIPQGGSKSWSPAAPSANAPGGGA